MAKKKSETYYVVSYRDSKDNDVKRLTVRSISDSNLGLTFVALSDFVFKDSVIIDPGEEDLKDRFADTQRLHLSIYSILSIEEKGAANKGLKFKHDKGQLLVLPTHRSEDS